MPKLLVAACALVDAGGRILLQQRPPGRPLAGLWEFPGGKVEPGERVGAALARELAEELGITIDPADVDPITFACEGQGERELILFLYGCRRWVGNPRALDSQQIAWLAPEAMDVAAMPPADRGFPAAIAAWLASRAEIG